MSAVSTVTSQELKQLKLCAKLNFNLKQKVVRSSYFICPGRFSFKIIKIQAIKINIIKGLSAEIGMGRVLEDVRTDFQYTIQTPYIHEEWLSFA
jgi:hypothetical protein